MCLASVSDIEVKKKIKSTIPKEGMKVYKIVGVRDGKYYQLFRDKRAWYEEGTNTAHIEKIHASSYYKYDTGFHFFTSKEVADNYAAHISHLHKRGELNPSLFQGKYAVIECIVKKSWVTEMGMQWIKGISRRVLVAKKAIFPKFEEKE